MKKIQFTLTVFLLGLFFMASAQSYTLTNVSTETNQSNTNFMSDTLTEAQIKLLIPAKDMKGLHGGLSIGFLPIFADAVTKSWDIRTTCDCSGRVVSIDTVASKQSYFSAKPILSLFLEHYVNNQWSFKISAYQSSHILDSTNSIVFSENNKATSLREYLTLRQRVLQLSAKYHFKNVYAGSGLSYARLSANTALTTELNTHATNTTSETPPQYVPVALNKNVLSKGVWHPQFFVGYTSEIFAGHIDLELGYQAERFYGGFNIAIPFSKTKRQYNIKRTLELLKYQKPSSDDGGGSIGGGPCGSF
jgi:hypothetical protein